MRSMVKNCFNWRFKRGMSLVDLISLLNVTVLPDASVEFYKIILYKIILYDRSVSVQEYII